MHVQPQPRPRGYQLFDEHEEPLAGSAPIYWNAVLAACPICRVIGKPRANPNKVTRVLILTTSDALPGPILAELAAAMGAGGSIAIHAPSHTAAEAAALAIKSTPPRWLA